MEFCGYRLQDYICSDENDCCTNKVSLFVHSTSAPQFRLDIYPRLVAKSIKDKSANSSQKHTNLSDLYCGFSGGPQLENAAVKYCTWVLQNKTILE